MAQRIKPQPSGGGGDPKSNVEARDHVINKAFAEIGVIDNRIEELKVIHIKPVADDRKRAWRNLKTDTGIDGKDLALAYKVYRRHQEAEAADDEADRDRIQDNLRSAFEALAAGDQLDWLSAMVGGGGDGKPNDGDVAPTGNAFDEGRAAGQRGDHLGSNPYDDAAARADWADGWEAGQADLAATMTPKEAA